MLVRSAQAEDFDALGEVFYRAVRIGAADAYTPKQLAVWARKQPSGADWAARFEGLTTLVADAGQGPVGFMSVRECDGYLDLAFVQPEMRGQGVAASIYAVLENRMRVAGLSRLHCHASHLAKSFFLRVGWDVLRPNTVEREGVVLDNWVMEKRLV